MQDLCQKCINFAFFLILKLGGIMKKSNKITMVYVSSSLLLFLTLLCGGVYGIYLSVGLSFMRSTASPPADIIDGAPGYVSNVSYGATANFQPSMTGVIILSAILIFISIAYFVSLIKQLIFFKQYKLIRESGIEHFVERKIKSKSSVIFFACLINVVSFLAGVAGIFVNLNSFIDGGLSWILYVIDGLVAVLAVVSFVLLIKKVQMNKKNKENNESMGSQHKSDKNRLTILGINANEHKEGYEEDKNLKIDSVEYILLKLKSMKESKIISSDEYDYLREKMVGIPKQKKIKKSKVQKK